MSALLFSYLFIVCCLPVILYWFSASCCAKIIYLDLVLYNFFFGIGSLSQFPALLYMCRKKICDVVSGLRAERLFAE